ncbi:hypothetical protein ACVWWO_006464 [Bradyrhizobium sp. F1.13.1]
MIVTISQKDWSFSFSAQNRVGTTSNSPVKRIFGTDISGKYVTVLIPGYVGALSCEASPFIDIVETEFSFDAFKECHEAFEKVTTWEYKGGTDLIATIVSKNENKLQFDYTNAIAVSINSLDADGKFDLGRYVIDLINSAKASADDPFAEIQKKDATGFLFGCVRAALPKPLQEILGIVAKCNLRRPNKDLRRT